MAGPRRGGVLGSSVAEEEWVVASRVESVKSVPSSARFPGSGRPGEVAFRLSIVLGRNNLTLD